MEKTTETRRKKGKTKNNETWKKRNRNGLNRRMFRTTALTASLAELQVSSGWCMNTFLCKVLTMSSVESFALMGHFVWKDTCCFNSESKFKWEPIYVVNSKLGTSHHTGPSFFIMALWAHQFHYIQEKMDFSKDDISKSDHFIQKHFEKLCQTQGREAGNALCFEFTKTFIILVITFIYYNSSPIFFTAVLFFIV